MRLLIPLLLVLYAITLAQAVDEGDLRAALAKGDKALAAAKQDWHLAQAKAKEAVVKDLTKLLSTESKKKNSTLAEELRRRIDLLTTEIANLKDEPMMIALEINQALIEGTFTGADYDNLITEREVTVDSKEELVETKVKLDASNVWLVVPNPRDTWKGNGGMAMVDYRGILGPQGTGVMRLMIKIGDFTMSPKDYLVRNQAGRLVLGPNDEKDFSDNAGVLHVKLVQIR